MVRKALLGRVSDVDIRLLRVFRSVVACGGVSAAELELNIGRSTISRHLTDLELRLGIKLCDRGPGGFALTDEGQRVYEASSRLLAAISDFQADVHEVHQRLTGHLVIAFFDKTVTNPEVKISEGIKLFDDIAPEVTLEVHVEPINVIESGVLDGRYHLGIIPTHRPSSSLDYYSLYTEQMYLYCGAGHPLFEDSDKRITKRDITQHKYTGFRFHSANMMVGRDLKLKRAADVYTEEALAALVLSGRYIGFLPDHFAEIFVQRGTMRILRPDAFHYRTSFAAIVRRSPKPSRLVASLLDCLCRAHGTTYDALDDTLSPLAVEKV